MWTVSTKNLHHRLLTKFQMQIWLEVLWTWGLGRLQVHGIRSRRLFYKKVVEVWSNYKSYFWWFGIPTCGIWLVVTRLKKTRVVYLLDLSEWREENRQFYLVHVELSQMIGLMVVMLMSYSCVVSVVVVLWGVGPILGNGYAGWHSRNLKLGIDSCRIAIITTYIWSNGYCLWVQHWRSQFNFRESRIYISLSILIFWTFC